MAILAGCSGPKTDAVSNQQGLHRGGTAIASQGRVAASCIEDMGNKVDKQRDWTFEAGDNPSWKHRSRR